jgi:hypothetical protein
LKHFYFYDCPRTGGTSFKRWSRSSDKIKRIYFGEGKGWHHVPFKPRAEIQELFPRHQVFTFTLLRNPYEHTASLYAKIRQHKHSYRKNLAGLSFAQWVHGPFEADVASSPAAWGFSMVRFFDPITGDLSTAIKNIETMDFVGFTELLNTDLDLMFKKANIMEKFDGRRLNNKHRNFKITDEDKAVIRRVRADDFRLVNHFRRKRGLKPYG